MERSRMARGFAAFGLGLALVVVVQGQSLGSGNSADNLMSRFGTPLTVYHLFSAADGKSGIELMKLPGTSLHDMRQAIVSRPAEGVNIFYFEDGDVSPWHTATDRYLVTLLQGEFIIDVDDGKKHRLVPGNVLFSEDWSGKGHRTLCVAKHGQKVCVLEQIILGKIDKSRPLATK